MTAMRWSAAWTRRRAAWATCSYTPEVEQLDQQVLALGRGVVEQGGERALGQHHALGELLEVEPEQVARPPR